MGKRKEITKERLERLCIDWVKKANEIYQKLGGKGKISFAFSDGNIGQSCVQFFVGKRRIPFAIIVYGNKLICGHFGFAHSNWDIRVLSKLKRVEIGKAHRGAIGGTIATSAWIFNFINDDLKEIFNYLQYLKGEEVNLAYCHDYSFGSVYFFYCDGFDLELHFMREQKLSVKVKLDGRIRMMRRLNISDNISKLKDMLKKIKISFQISNI